MTAQEIIKLLDLKPLQVEGGYYREIYRSDEKHGPEKSLATAIYFLLTPDMFSEMHRLDSDEIFHFYLGDPVEMLLLYPDRKGEIVILGNDLTANQKPQIVVPKMTWQGGRLARGGAFALMGTTFSPGFEFNDYQSGTRSKLISEFPDHADLITSLTRK